MLCLLGLSACNGSNPQTHDDEPKADSIISTAVKDTKLPQALEDGIYLAIRKGKSTEELNPTEKGEQVLAYSNDFKEEDDFSHVVVNLSDFVPFLLKEEPGKEAQEDGKTRLLLALNESGTEQLKDFTTRNVDKTIATVIGGEVVSMHKIREPITEGKLQVTNCSGTACERLFLELQDNLKN